VTEQIERELTELFRERAERLDVLPPLPPARVRRARLQSAMAMASVLAILAAGGVVGLRLASASGTGNTSIAGSGSPRAELERIGARMLAGRWRVDVTAHDNPATTTRGPGPAEFTMDLEYDGTTKSGIARRGGTVIAIEVAGVTYTALDALPLQMTQYLPKGAHWQRSASPLVDGGSSAILGLPTTGRVQTSGSPSSGHADDWLDGATVRRTPTGFSLDTHDGDRSAHTDVVMRADGTMASTRTVERRPTSGSSDGGPQTMTEFVIDGVFTPLTAPVQVQAPDPATIVTEAQIQAAIHESMFGSGASSGPTCTAPAPTVVHHSTSGGSAATPPSPMRVESCHLAVTVTPVSPSPH